MTAATGTRNAPQILQRHWPEYVIEAWALGTFMVSAGLFSLLFEAPVSGMSMNPARSFASAAPAGLWAHLWIYFVAPPVGMLAAAAWRRRCVGAARLPCAKLQHPLDVRCIHCGYEPPGKSASEQLPSGVVHP